MRQVWVGFLVLMLGGAIAACNTSTVGAPGANPVETPVAQAPASPAVTPSPSPSIELGTFGFDEIYEIGAAGCGMTLWTTEEAVKPAGDRQFLLLSGMEENSTLMKIDGEIVRFQRTDSSGEAFYGQFASQTFRNEEEALTLQVDVTLGERGEIESVAIPEGTVRLEALSGTVEVPVVGDAGC